jgi:hypothetical protein
MLLGSTCTPERDPLESKPRPSVDAGNASGPAFMIRYANLTPLGPHAFVVLTVSNIGSLAARPNCTGWVVSSDGTAAPMTFDKSPLIRPGEIRSVRGEASLLGKASFGLQQGEVAFVSEPERMWPTGMACL